MADWHSFDIRNDNFLIPFLAWVESEKNDNSTITPPIVSGDLKEEYKEIYSQWVSAGGIDNNFRAHLLGTGTLMPNKDDLLFLLNQANAVIAQIKTVIDKLVGKV